MNTLQSSRFSKLVMSLFLALLSAGVAIWFLAEPVPSALAQSCSVPGTHATIQLAINAGAGVCDTITVASGTYNENLTIDRSLILQGADKTSTIIDGNGANRVILITGNSNVVVQINDLRITGGNATPASTNKGNGGGILVTGGAVLDADDIQIDDNIGNTDSTLGSGFGGGLAVINNSSVYLTSTMIFSNVAKPSGTGLGQGGGLYANNAVLSLVNSQIMNNSANVNGSSSGKGGGLFVNTGSQITLNGNTWQANTARNNSTGDVEGSGGAIAVEFPTGTTVVTITDDIFTSNVANASNTNLTGGDKARGGAIFLNTTNTGGQITANLTGVTIDQNTAKAGSSNTGEGQGGAIYARHTTLVVRKATIVDNQAAVATANDTGDGGGIYIREPQTGDFLEVTNSVLAGNTAFNTPGSGDGAQLHIDYTSASQNSASIVHTTIADDDLNSRQGIYYRGPTSGDMLAITNTIVTSHTSGIDNVNATGFATARYMLFYNNTNNQAPGSTAFPDTTGWVAGDPDPLFIDPANNDYHIRLNSPAVDVGTNAGVIDDIDGDLRDADPDIGADELSRIYLPIVVK